MRLLFQLKVGRLDAALEFTSGEKAGMKFAHVIDVSFRHDLVFHTKTPVRRVHKQPPQTFALQIDRCSDGAAKYPRRFAVIPRVIANPD